MLQSAMEQHAFTVSEPRWVEKKWTEHYGKRRLTSSGWKEKGHTSCSNPESLQQLYISFVRLHLVYAAPVWDFQLQKDVDKLEKNKSLQCDCAKSIDWLEMTAYF